MIYTLINFNKLNLSTLSFNCLGFVHERFRCKNTITLAANKRAKHILQNLELNGKTKTICCSVILLADACICEDHARRPTAIIYAATEWLANLSITLGEEIKLAECTKCTATAAFEKKNDGASIKPDKATISCFDQFLQHTQQLEQTIEILKINNKMIESTNDQLEKEARTLLQIQNDQSYVLQQDEYEIQHLLNVNSQKDLHIEYLTRSLALSGDKNRQLQISASNLTIRLVKFERLAHEKGALILTLQAGIALLEDKLEAAGLDTISRVTLLENPLKAYQERPKQGEEATNFSKVNPSQLENRIEGLQVVGQQKENIIVNLESRIPVDSGKPTSSEENSPWLFIPGLGDRRPITPDQSPCSSRQDTPQRD